MLRIALLLALPGVSALQDVAFNWTLTDMDTILRYTPSSTGNKHISWEASYAGSPSPILPLSRVVGTGESKHTTAFPGATVTLAFYGSAVYFYGSSDAAGLRFTVDGVNTDFKPTTSLLAWSESGLGYHTAVLSLLSGQVSLDTVLITSSVRTQAPSLDSMVRRHEPFRTSTGKSAFYTFSGRWDTLDSIGGDEGSQPASIRLVVGQPGSSAWASVPANTSYLVLNGTTQPHIAYYTVTLDPPAPGMPAPFDADSRQSFCAPVTLFMATLDPTVRYNLTITVGGTKVLNGDLELVSTTFYSALWDAASSSASPSSSSRASPSGASATPSSAPKADGLPKAAITGGAVGLAVLAILAGIGAWMFWRRKRTIHREPSPALFVDDPLPPTTPYIRMSSMSSSHAPTASTTNLPSALSAPHAPRLSLVPLGIANPDEETLADLPPVAKHRPRPRPFPPQETDAGRVPDSVPPRYDPSWAGDFESQASPGPSYRGL